MTPCPRKLSLLFWTTVLSFGLASFANEKPCTLHDGGNYYDINPLKASKDYQFTTDNGHKFYLNVCRGVTTEPWNTGVPESDGDIAGLIRRDQGDFAIGMVNTTLEMKQGGLILRQSNGSPCIGIDNERGSSTIRFICDASVYAAGMPVLLDQWPSDDEKACHYELEWRTHFACPTGERGVVSGLIIFNVIAIMILVMSYIVISTLYNRFVLHLHGYDQMPNFSLSHAIEIAEVCSDCLRSLWDSLCFRLNSWKNRGQRDFNAASHHWTSREEEEAMIAADPLETESGPAGREHDADSSRLQGSEDVVDRGIIRL